MTRFLVCLLIAAAVFAVGVLLSGPWLLVSSAIAVYIVAGFGFPDAPGARRLPRERNHS